MLKLLVDFGPAAFFYIIALAVQVSGYTNTKAAAGLAAFATVLLVFPLWDLSPPLAMLFALVAATSLLGVLAWRYRSKFPWRLRLERIDQRHAGQATGAVHTDAHRLSMQGWRISHADAHVAEPLAKLIVRADELIERRVKTKDEFNRWRADHGVWFDETMSCLRRVLSESHALSFSELQSIYFGDQPNAFNKEHEGMLHLLIRRRKWLREKHALNV